MGVTGGRQKPPPPMENEEDLMLTMACKEVVEPARTSEMLYDNMGKCARKNSAKGKTNAKQEEVSSSCDPVALTAPEVCKNHEGVACSYEKKTDAEAKDEKKAGSEG